MSTDRELLELAAKAAGIELAWHKNAAPTHRISGVDYFWCPMDSDGDAFRLAVKLRIDVIHYWGQVLDEGQSPFVEAVHCERDVVNFPGVFEDIGSDGFASTRRAIVRAAASIGEKLCRT